jgi:hypothetical protein
MIRSLKGNSSWCFEWLQHLVDFKDLDELNDKDRQVHLMSINHRDNAIIQIRSKLGHLQMQTVIIHLRRRKFKLTDSWIFAVIAACLESYGYDLSRSAAAGNGIFPYSS